MGGAVSLRMSRVRRESSRITIAAAMIQSRPFKSSTVKHSTMRPPLLTVYGQAVAVPARGVWRFPDGFQTRMCALVAYQAGVRPGSST